MENPEEILHSLEEFSKLKPRDIPRELEEYLCFVAKTGDPVYQWSIVKSLFKEKLQSVVAEFYESCPSVEIPPCPNVDVFNYETMKVFILEKLDTFVAAPFTVQRISELLTTPRKEYNRIDKYMRALEKNILVVSTTEPGNRHNTENGDGIVNGIESEHVDTHNSNDINVEETDDAPVWSRIAPDIATYQHADSNVNAAIECVQDCDNSHPIFNPETPHPAEYRSSIESVITCRSNQEPYVSIEPVVSESCLRDESPQQSDVTVTITAVPAAVQKRRTSIEPIVSSEEGIDSETKERVELKISENVDLMQKPLVENKENLPSPDPTDSLHEDTKKFEPCESTSSIDEQAESSSKTDEPIESTSSEETFPAQISIISNIDEDFPIIENEKKSPLLGLDDCESTFNVVTDVHMKDESQDESEQLAEVSTTVTSSVDSEVPESSEYKSSSPLSKETPVSSTDDSTDALNVDSLEEPKSEDFQQEVLQRLPEELLIDDTLTVDKDQVDNKLIVDTPLDSIQEFAPSSTSQLSMDIDIGEESCEDLPATE